MTCTHRDMPFWGNSRDSVQQEADPGDEGRFNDRFHECGILRGPRSDGIFTFRLPRHISVEKRQRKISVQNRMDRHDPSKDRAGEYSIGSEHQPSPRSVDLERDSLEVRYKGHHVVVCSEVLQVACIPDDWNKVGYRAQLVRGKTHAQ